MKSQKSATNFLKVAKKKLFKLFTIGIVFYFCLGVNDYSISRAFSEYTNDVIGDQENERDVIPQIEDEAIQDEEKSSLLNKLGRLKKYDFKSMAIRFF